MTTVRLATVETERGPRACALAEGHCIDLNDADPALPSTVRGLLALGPDGLRRAAQGAAPGPSPAARPLARARLLAPVPDPRKVVCLGLNYRDHAVETGAAIPEEPILFSKYPTAIIGPEAP